MDLQGQGSIGAVALDFHPDAEWVHEAVLKLAIDSRLNLTWVTGRLLSPWNPCRGQYHMVVERIGAWIVGAPSATGDFDWSADSLLRYPRSDGSARHLDGRNHGEPARRSPRHGSLAGEWTEHRVSVGESWNGMRMLMSAPAGS